MAGIPMEYSPESTGDDRMQDLPVAMVQDKHVRQLSDYAPLWPPGHGVQGAIGVPADASRDDTPLARRQEGDDRLSAASTEDYQYDSETANEETVESVVSKADENFILQLAKDIGADAQRTVSEMYSPPRVTAAAGRLKYLELLPGFAMDLTTCDEAGVAWDFDIKERRDAARARVLKEKPMLLIGTPMCKAFSSWQHLNDVRRDPQVVEKEKVQARVHLAFMCELYHAQVNAGRYFLHEHPGQATSWQEECIEEVMDREGGEVAIADRCQYGQQEDGLPI